MNTTQTAALAWMTVSFCQGPSVPDVSQCEPGEAVVQCTYGDGLSYPECPQEDASSPWAGHCIWQEARGLFGRSGWKYPACPTNEVCVPTEDLDALRGAIDDGDFSAWCYPSQTAPEPTWVHIPGEPGPQPCLTQSVTWEPQDSQGQLAL